MNLGTGWATAQETAYPWPLSRRLATHVSLHLQNNGVRCPTPTFAKHANHLDCIRQQIHVQHSATGLPWVSEFSHTMQISAQDPVPPNARLLTTPALGGIARVGCKTISLASTGAQKSLWIKQSLLDTLDKVQMNCQVP
jgi:hypothetical protein